MATDLMAREIAVCDLVETVHAAHFNRKAPRTDDDDELRDRLRPLCREAVRLGVRPERLIILIKNACVNLPKPRLHSEKSETLPARLVKIAIDEFYGVAERTA
ncbi:MAG: hypothetical protein ABI446_08060 [Gemmatimonadaceae bacterium]